MIFLFFLAGPSNHHSQSTLRPPLPPPHNHTLSHHHSSANSLNRNSLTNRRNQIHAPAPAPNDLATTPESVQLQDSWVLNSNVPLETRHFLFKTSSGTTPLFSSSSPGYPLTSGTVYTPPPRLLPRNTFSRNAFKLKKPSKYCSWKCAALSAIAAAVLLAILLAYFIGLSSPGEVHRLLLGVVLGGQELGVLMLQIRSNDNTFVTLSARGMLQRTLKAAIHSLYMETLKRKPDQGKAFELTSKWDASNHFLAGGGFTRFADWRFIHRARLNCVPLNGATTGTETSVAGSAATPTRPCPTSCAAASPTPESGSCATMPSRTAW
ncbi:Teneurin-2 [Chelonia mydas]|uniref:Teneurin-2 n=1 Tax=Chelonia mydas TaxID=8469 RepID=M7B933_CHEMY|nr:Teneurin-2 [Chelonia mydas]